MLERHGIRGEGLHRNGRVDRSQQENDAGNIRSKALRGPCITVVSHGPLWIPSKSSTLFGSKRSGHRLHLTNVVEKYEKRVI